jgi:hypothetical protein
LNRLFQIRHQMLELLCGCEFVFGVLCNSSSYLLALLLVVCSLVYMSIRPSVCSMFVCLAMLYEEKTPVISHICYIGINKINFL